MDCTRSFYSSQSIDTLHLKNNAYELLYDIKRTPLVEEQRFERRETSSPMRVTVCNGPQRAAVADRFTKYFNFSNRFFSAFVFHHSLIQPIDRDFFASSIIHSTFFQKSINSRPILKGDEAVRIFKLL
jgi:hypothetical protein